MMNERIKQLAVKAGLYFYLPNGNAYPCSFTAEECEISYRNFAELIIQECVSTLNDMHLWQSVNNQNYPNSWHDTVDQGIDAIKSHFGVD